MQSTGPEWSPGFQAWARICDCKNSWHSPPEDCRSCRQRRPCESVLRGFLRASACEPTTQRYSPSTARPSMSTVPAVAEMTTVESLTILPLLSTLASMLGLVFPWEILFGPLFVCWLVAAVAAVLLLALALMLPMMLARLRWAASRATSTQS